MTETKPKRRWIRFSLRTMFVLVTVLCVWLGNQASSVRQRKQLLSKLDSVVNGLPTYKTVNRNGQQFVLNGDFATPADLRLSWIRRVFGDQFIPCICLPESMSPEEVGEFKSAFPESIISQISNHAIFSHSLVPAPGKHFARFADTFTIE